MEKILLGMSGGTDSTVAALLLQEQGYEVVGVTFRFYEKEGDQTHLEDARQAARFLGIEHHTIDLRARFEEEIIQYFIAEYMEGHTPVPCIKCNNRLKLPLLAEIADSMGIRTISMGHYVQVRQRDGYYYVEAGADPDKDQSFFLWGLQQELLARVYFPLGKLTKVAVRAYAAERGLHRAATKHDSIGVCFCPGDYATFLRQRLPAERFVAGDFVDEAGQVVGRHKGFPFYTVGQRRGLGVQFPYPVFVQQMDTETHRITLAPLQGMYKTKLLLREVNVVNPADFAPHQEVICRVRYRKQNTPCRVTFLADGSAEVEFLEAVNSIAVGQAAAFYRGAQLLGGGIIAASW